LSTILLPHRGLVESQLRQILLCSRESFRSARISYCFIRHYFSYAIEIFRLAAVPAL
jgi:hypothetical protein